VQAVHEADENVVYMLLFFRPLGSSSPALHCPFCGQSPG